VRSELIDASMQLVGRGGIEALTIKAVTSEIGISLGAFYNYFGSKEALIEATVDWCAQASFDLRAQLSSGELSLADAVHQFVEVAVGQCRADPNRAPFLAAAKSAGLWGDILTSGVAQLAVLAATFDPLALRYPSFFEKSLKALIIAAYGFLSEHPEALDDPGLVDTALVFAARVFGIDLAASGTVEG
jgi:AcrR family transcriptional regulator